MFMGCWLPVVCDGCLLYFQELLARCLPGLQVDLTLFFANLEYLTPVIRAKAGIQCPDWLDVYWIPAFAGMTDVKAIRDALTIKHPPSPRRRGVRLEFARELLDSRLRGNDGTGRDGTGRDRLGWAGKSMPNVAQTHINRAQAAI